jgi:hypothetical protein
LVAHHHHRFGGGFPHNRPSLNRNTQQEKRRFKMDQTNLIRIVSGVLFAIVLVVLVQRRRTQTK